MSKKGEYLRALVTERLTAAAEEIFALFERTIVEYEEELFRSKEENQRHKEENQRQQQLLDSVLSPQLQHKQQDAPPQSPLACPDRGETDSPPITDSSDPFETHWPAVVKTELDEHTDDSEDWEAPCGSSAPSVSKQEEEEQSDSLDSPEGNPQVPKSHQCCFCDESFSRSQDLKKHMEIHALEIHMENLNRTKQSAEALRHCSSSSSSYGAVTKPVVLPPRIRVGAAHGPPFSCPFCKRCFARKFDLRSHILIHTGEKPFACSQCNMRFNRKSNLYRHFRNHAKKT